MTLSIAVEYLLNRRKQAVISIVGVMVGVAFFLGIAGMMRGMHDYFILKLIDAAPHVKIIDEYRNPQPQPVAQAYPDAVVALRGIKPEDEMRGIRSADRIISYLQTLDGVAVAPALQGQAFLRYGGKDLATSITGIQPDLERKASNLERDMVAGSLANLLTNANGIILGAELARKLSVRMGSKLTVISSAGVIRKMKVVGLFQTGVTEVDGSTSYALLKKVQILQDRQDVINRINMRLDDVDAAPVLAKTLESRYGYRAEAWQETYANIFEMFVIENIIMYSTVAAILIVAGFGIYNIISTSVNEKARDIAILKSIGFAQADIKNIFVLQGVIVGLVGTLAGWALGAVMIELIANIRIPEMEEMPIIFEGFPVYRSVWLYVWGGVMAVVSATISAWLPARRAAALDPVDIIRGAS